MGSLSWTGNKHIDFTVVVVFVLVVAVPYYCNFSFVPRERGKMEDPMCIHACFVLIVFSFFRVAVALLICLTVCSKML